MSTTRASSAGSPALRSRASLSALAGAVALLTLYFAMLTALSGWSFAREQFAAFWPFVIALAGGFGVQAGLFVYLRGITAAAPRKVLATTGTTSGAAMISCCTHYLVNVLPVLGATGLVTFVAQYQIQLFWIGIASNLAGVAFIGRRVAAATRGG